MSSVNKSTERNEVVSEQKEEGSRDMESERQGHIEYKGLGIQRKTNKETSGSIYGFIHH